MSPGGRMSALVPALLHPVVSTLIGAVAACATTVAILYPLALHDWGNEARNIAGVADFYEPGPADALVDSRSTQRPSEYLRVTVDTLAVTGDDPAAACVARLAAADGPFGEAAGLPPVAAAIERVCRRRDTVVGRFAGDDGLVAAVPVVDGDDRLVGVRVQQTRATESPTLVGAVTERRALLVIAAVSLLVGGIGFLAGRLGRAHIDQLTHAASIDGLTGCLRREALVEAARDAVRSARRRRGTLSVLAVDVDWLKHINDRFGHAGGDAALALVAASLRTSLRTGDVLGRTGGDEFVALLPDADAATAAAVAGRLHAASAVLHLALKNEVAALSVSIGAATLADGDDAASLIDRADAALYEAKRKRATTASPQRGGRGAG